MFSVFKLRVKKMFNLFKNIREKTTTRWHKHLMQKNEAYFKWHQHPRHEHSHILMFLATITLSFILVFNSTITVGHSNDAAESGFYPDGQGLYPTPVENAPVENVATNETTGEVIPTPVDESAVVVDAEPVSVEGESPLTIEPVPATEPESPTTTEPTPEPVQVQEVVPVVFTESAPVVKNVTSAILKGTFKSGAIPVVVSFDKAVVVSGNPKLILETGSPSTTEITYKGGSGTSRLIFLYKIVEGNYSDDLSYSSTGALELNGGSIKGKNSGLNAELNLPSPGSVSSLSGYSDIIINTDK